MGSPHTDPNRHLAERPALRRISRNYAIASKPVTLAQWQLFLRDRPDVPRDWHIPYSPEANGPIIRVSWYAAAQYCNWLSEKEGLPESEWCYPRHADLKEGMKQLPGYLKRKGYRVPTEAEWEYACRAGAVTTRYYGSSSELMSRYAWFQDNSLYRTWPVGQKRPKDLGLFDMLGQVYTWCQDRYVFYPRTGTNTPTEDVEDTKDISGAERRVFRGGAFFLFDASGRGARRYSYQPSGRDDAAGVRVARTMP
jgi:formylglycine-generating enzyme required for sulfatase activity